ncbi:MAG: PTS glucose transporter subunit IIA [Clostridium sp.]|nr:PTS glucose transporter subunit IIA [Acetatifactor muris]MCM1526837.1 PTS glucose transporter subunit IIA [Bacteroides sp.]MCM1562963.1 PTS glucose transporter subunit IIA [Clostridium sp.]
MDTFVVAAVAIVAAMAGFWTGRSIQWQLAEADAAEPTERLRMGTGAEPAAIVEMTGCVKAAAGCYKADLSERAADAEPARGSLREYARGGREREPFPGRLPSDSRRRINGRFDKRRQTKTVSLGREIGSPVTGQVSVFEEDGQCKLRILPDKGQVYAPAAGRIRRLYPMGSAMLLQTEFGADILLRIGSNVDEMCSGYYSCRVMEHEYIRKGSLLLEYDPAGLCGEGAEPEIILSVESGAAPGSVTFTGKSRVRAGEPVLYVVCDKHSESYEKLV